MGSKSPVPYVSFCVSSNKILPHHLMITTHSQHMINNIFFFSLFPISNLNHTLSSSLLKCRWKTLQNITMQLPSHHRASLTTALYFFFSFSVADIKVVIKGSMRIILGALVITKQWRFSHGIGWRILPRSRLEMENNKKKKKYC